MLRGDRLTLAGVIALAILAGEARAQFGLGYYPGGYGGFGWGGWGGAGSTVQGSIAQGLGYYAMGAGMYNYDTAVADSINADTLMRWNQYWWLSQQEANRREYARMARRHATINATADQIQDRLRYNPSRGDIDSGDALNAILDQITSPRIHSSALRLATAPIKASSIRDIPFQDASEAATIVLSQLSGQKEGWPRRLREPDFDSVRQAYQDAVAKAMKEDEEGDISSRTLASVRSAVEGLRLAIQQKIPQKDPDYIPAENYLKTLAGVSRMLESPQVDKILAELGKIDRTSLGNLLGFMHSFNLRFGPATTPRSQAVYRELYPLMLSHRDRVLKEAGSEPVAAKDTNPPPTDFFRGMKLEHVTGQPPSPPGPNPPPPPR
jgi:hypothetical protein